MFMRMPFLVFFIFTVIGSFGQVIYNPNIVQEYERAYKNLPSHAKQIVQTMKHGHGYSGGICLTVLSLDDTLNRNDFRPSTGKTVIELLPATTPVEEDTADAVIMMVTGFIQNDTLSIQVIPWFFSSQTIKLIVTGNQVQTSFNEYYKQDSILGISATTKTNSIKIPVTTIHFVLNKKISVNDKIIYGEAGFITAPYYYLAANNFKDDILKHRWHYKNYFKFKPKKLAVK